MKREEKKWRYGRRRRTKFLTGSFAEVKRGFFFKNSKEELEEEGPSLPQEISSKNGSSSNKRKFLT